MWTLIPQGNKAGDWSSHIVNWSARLSGRVRAAEQDSGREGTQGGRVAVAVRLSIRCLFVKSPLLRGQLFLSMHLSAPFRHSCMRLLSSSAGFLFPIIILTTVTDLSLATLSSSRPPSLLPSILHMSVGSRTISRGSRWPAAPSLWSFPAIVPGPTAAWLPHSINHTCWPSPQRLAGASITGEDRRHRRLSSSSRVGNPGKCALRSLNRWWRLAFYIRIN